MPRSSASCRSAGKRRQHRNAARDMKTAHHDGQPAFAEFTAEIERARILVRLHADQPDHAAAGGADALRHALDIDDGVALVAGLDLDIDVGTEHALVGALLDQPIDAGEAVRRQRRAQPLDDIAIRVVMRRLDQNDAERALGRASVQCTPSPKGNPTYPGDLEASRGPSQNKSAASRGNLRFWRPVCNGFRSRVPAL